MNPIARHRGLMALSNKRLRRARRLYFRLCRDAVMQSTDNTVMHAMIRKMKERGLYAFPASDQIPWRDFRFRIARHLYRQHMVETGQVDQHRTLGRWTFWYLGNGFDCDFNRSVRKAESA